MQDAAGAQPDLPDDAVVIRGGLMAMADLRRSAQIHFDHEGRYALSVFCGVDASADAIARAASLPHPKIRQSTVGRIRRAGFDVVRSEGPPGHADLVLPDPPTDDDWRALEAAFDPPRHNAATMESDDV